MSRFPATQHPDSIDVVALLTDPGLTAAGPIAAVPEGALLPATQVQTHEDVHDLIDRLSTPKLRGELEAMGFVSVRCALLSIVVSELAQNIIEHAAAPGWAAVWRTQQDLCVAISDDGRGFRGSLEESVRDRYGDRWDDLTALTLAVVHSQSRFRDPGRGQGLSRVRKRIDTWGGSLSIRSGTTTLSERYGLGDEPNAITGLPEIAGAHLLITIPIPLR